MRINHSRQSKICNYFLIKLLLPWLQPMTLLIKSVMKIHSYKESIKIPYLLNFAITNEENDRSLQEYSIIT